MQATAGRFFLGLLSSPFSFSHFHCPVHGPSRCLWLCSPSDLQYNLILTQTWEWSCPHCHSPLMFLMQILCLATYFFLESTMSHGSSISLSPFFLPQAPTTLSRNVWADYCVFSKWTGDKVFPVSGELRYRVQGHARCLAPCSDLVLGRNTAQQPFKS